MKYTHKVTVEWKNKNPIQQTMLMVSMNKFFEKVKKKGKDDFIYTMMPEEEKFVLTILCNEKFASEQKNTWMGKKLGVSLNVEEIK
jgi:hypothetical protein